MKKKVIRDHSVPTFAVLVSSSGEIVDVRTYNQSKHGAVSVLPGRMYAMECAASYRPIIKAVLNREQPLLSAVMPPPTLGIEAWFAVVGVSLSSSKDTGALFVHMDITRWVSGNEARLAPPTKLSIDVLQSAIASTFANEPRVAAMARPHGDDIEGLTARQLQVLKAIGQGKSNVEISQDLSCSLNTVKRHVTAVLQKLKVPNRTRAAMLINHMEKS